MRFRNRGHAPWALALAAVAWAGSPAPAPAQVTLDGTTGPARALRGPDYRIGAELGRTEGANLFHSFERFSVRTGESATFSGPDNIANVISRVTGGERSEINGALRSTIPGADFFFLNPAGVVFGPHATLNVQGSFHVSTADELRFDDGAVFSATDPGASSFTLAPPEAFGFLGAEPAGVTVDESMLEVPPGEALSFVGDAIDIVGGFIRAGAGRVTLAALAGPGAAPVADGEIAATAFADIHLTGRAVVDVSGDGGGAVRIRGGRFVIENQSTIFATNIGPTDARAGIDIEAEAVTVGLGSALTTDTGSVFGGAGKGGPLTVRAGKVVVTDGGAISSSSNFGGGHAGEVAVTATDMLEVRRGGTISSDSRLFSTGKGGLLTVRAGKVVVADGGAISSSTSGEGHAGEVAVTATGMLEVRRGGTISSGTRGFLAKGNGGTVRVKAERLLVSGKGSEPFTGITSQANPGSTGAAGSVTVTAGDLEVRDGGLITSGTFGPGDAGTVTVQAERLLHIDGEGDAPYSTGISSSANFFSTGKAGAVKVRAGALEIRDGGEISSATLGTGDAGTVTVQAERLLHIDGEGGERLTGISTSAALGIAPNGQIVVGTGAAGSVTVTVTAGELEVRDGGEITSFTVGPGDAGTVTVRAGSVEIIGSAGISTASHGVGEDAGKAGGIVLDATDTLRMSGGAAISAATRRADAGDIEVRVGRLVDLEDSAITTSVAGGTGGGGNISVDPEFVVLDGGRIVANARQGAGGNIDIVANHLFQTPDSVIDASSELGIDGEVRVDAPDVDVTSGLVTLPTAFLDASSQLRESCAARRSERTSSFIGVGRGGLPPGPDAPLPGFYTLSPGTPGAPAVAAAPAWGQMAGVEPAESAAPLVSRDPCAAR